MRAPLAAAGHPVHAVTLTGCGDRRHLLRRDTPGFTVVEMATGHYPQIQAPDDFVRVLLRLLAT